MKRVTNYSTDLYLLIYTKMARIPVKEDWGKEADENPFPSGGMMTFDGGLVYVFVSQPQLTPLAAVGRRGREMEDEKIPAPTLPFRRGKEMEEKKKPVPTLSPPQTVEKMEIKKKKEASPHLNPHRSR